jgi:hypothetical protein
MVVHNCNPSYLGGRYRIDVQGQPSKKLARISKNKLGMVVPACDPCDPL